MMNMADKVTNRDRFVALAELANEAGRTDLVEFAEHQIEILDKRKAAPKKPTANQIENENLKNEIAELAAGEGMTATEIAETVGKTVQKVAQLLKQLVAEGRVIRVEGKGKTKTLFVV